jgi:hypothetical protein
MQQFVLIIMSKEDTNVHFIHQCVGPMSHFECGATIHECKSLNSFAECKFIIKPISEKAFSFV